jgi:ribosomal protein S27AE
MEKREKEDAVELAKCMLSLAQLIESDVFVNDGGAGLSDLMLVRAKQLKDLARRVKGTQPRGKWVMIKYDLAACSQCGHNYFTEFDTTKEARANWNKDLPRFCPRCGARMRPRRCDEE